MNVSGDLLTGFFERRDQAIRSCYQARKHPSFELLARPVLQLAEEFLQRELGSEHYELSVWMSPAEPEIAAYYDSSKNSRPRTYVQRLQDPQFYREKRYKVIALLDQPDPEPIVMTRLSSSVYAYEGTTQREKVKSTVLYCFDLQRPAAMVLTSADPEAFSGSKRATVVELIRCLSLAVRADLDLIESNVAPEATEKFAFSWIHLSDIHFGAGSEHHQFDQKLVGDAIINDLAKLPGRSVDAIFITGDIAFKGAQSEYATASDWIRKVAVAAGVELDNVRLVPGNHDVQRNISNPEWLNAVGAVRREPTTLAGEINRSADSLLTRFENYQNFTQAICPNHPRSHWVGDWTEDRIIKSGTLHLNLRLAGLSSVWISDENDGDPGGKLFTPNMALALSQLEMVSAHNVKPDIVFLLSHHPPEWLFETCRDSLQRTLNRYEHLHLCGHIHVAGATKGSRFGIGESAFRFSAGAAHDEETPPGMHAGEHGYSWGAIRATSSGEWELGWAPRVFVPWRGIFRADATRYDLDRIGFAWSGLKQSSSR
jgi:hypothetical protein